MSIAVVERDDDGGPKPIGSATEMSITVSVNPDESTLEPRVIGSLRPPNEVCERVIQHVASSVTGDIPTDTEQRVAKVTVLFRTDSADIFEIDIERDYLSRTDADRSLLGDVIGGVIGDCPPYEPRQQKGWIEHGGDYYTPSATKPDEWTDVPSIEIE